MTLAAAFILPLNGIAALLRRLLPDRAKTNDPWSPLYLDESALATPSVALACAARETLHTGDLIETMLRQTRNERTTIEDSFAALAAALQQS